MSLTRVISTHTSRVGCDADTTNNCIVHSISTHTSRVGCDAVALFNGSPAIAISTHTSRVGCDLREMVFYRL